VHRANRRLNGSRSFVIDNPGVASAISQCRPNEKDQNPMASPPRRPVNPMDAAEALFKPAKRPAAPAFVAPAVPNAKELVSIRIDSAILEYFQNDGPGWQDRLNDTLRAALDGKI
jgi:uncharacterized protein (DUF4415 family)